MTFIQTTPYDAHLEKWIIVQEPVPHLVGIVYKHRRLPDGTEIRTSRLTKFDKENKKAMTLNTVYTLGEENNEQRSN